LEGIPVAVAAVGDGGGAVVAVGAVAVAEYSTAGCSTPAMWVVLYCRPPYWLMEDLDAANIENQHKKIIKRHYTGSCLVCGCVCYVIPVLFCT
jgi:hypothetical protein